jgi:uncharacterized damage-inducible protein DinB
MKSVRRVVLLLVGAAGAAAAQSAPAQQGATVPNQESAIEVRRQFLADLDSLHNRFVALANAFPADKFAWRPSAGVRSVGEVFMHVAAEYYVWTPTSYGMQRSPLIPPGRDNMQKFEAASTKADVLKHLADSFAYMHAQLDTISPATLAGQRTIWNGQRTIIETSFAMSDDLHEHLGQLIAYARMNGVVPPWSR